MTEKNRQVMISLPVSYHARLKERAKERGTNISKLLRYWIDREDRIEMKRTIKKARGLYEVTDF